MMSIAHLAAFTNEYLVFQQAAIYLGVAYCLFRKWEDSRPNKHHRSGR